MNVHSTVMWTKIQVKLIEDIYDRLGSVGISDECKHKLRSFRKLFQVLLGDNCDPQAPYQKGSAENNQALIRRIIPKRTSLDEFTKQDITLIMNHINSYGRPNLGDKTPYWVFVSLYGEEVLRRINVELIPPDKVTLHPSLLKR